MIPKIIHYCWFGKNPLPPLVEKCIDSWKKYLPDFEVKEWNEDNFDVNIIQYTRDAYMKKKYAFVSDYARFWIIYHEGGLYLDTDVEIIKPFDGLLSSSGFMGYERDPHHNHYGLVNPGLGFAAEKKNVILESLLEKYEHLTFLDPSGFPNVSETVVQHTTETLKKFGMKPISGIQKVGDIIIYPTEYFAPINIVTKRLHITEQTHSIHQYLGSWLENESSTLKKIRKRFPEWFLLLINRIKN